MRKNPGCRAKRDTGCFLSYVLRITHYASRITHYVLPHHFPSDQLDEQEDDFFPEIIELPLEDVLDLHSFPPKEIKSLVKDYLQDAYEAGFPEVMIIHGKGIGVQREIVRSVALRNPHVESVSQAPEGAGSWGATIVKFVKS